MILILLKVIMLRENQLLLLLLRDNRLLLGLLRGFILDTIRWIAIFLTFKLLEVFAQGKEETSLVWAWALKDHPVPFVVRRESICDLDCKVLERLWWKVVRVALFMKLVHDRLDLGVLIRPHVLLRALLFRWWLCWHLDIIGGIIYQWQERVKIPYLIINRLKNQNSEIEM